MQQRRQIAPWLPLALIAIVSLAATVRSFCGALHGNLFLEPDSYDYICLAQNLAHGHGFLSYEGVWVSDWPPLVPALLALLLPVCPSPIIAFGALSALCTGGILFLSGIWLQRHLPRIAALMVFLYLTVATPLRMATQAALSEPPFLLLTAAFFVLWDRFSENPTLRRRWALYTVVALCPLARYTGITVVAVAGLLLWLRGNKRPFSDRAREAIGFLAASLLPFAVWCLLNQHLTGCPMGTRTPSDTGLWQNLHLVAAVWTDWCLGSPILAVIIGVLLVSGIAFFFLQGRREQSRDITAPFLFAAAYFALLLYSACHVAFDPIDNRLLSPVYVPLVLFATALVARLLSVPLSSLKKPARPIVLVVLLLAGTLLIAHDAQSGREAVGERNEESTSLLSSPTFAALKHHPLPESGWLYSNEPGLCWYRLGRLAHYAPDPESDGDDMFQALHPGDHILWFLTDGIPDDDSDDDEDASTRHQLIVRYNKRTHVTRTADYPDSILLTVTR